MPILSPHEQVESALRAFPSQESCREAVMRLVKRLPGMVNKVMGITASDGASWRISSITGYGGGLTDQAGRLEVARSDLFVRPRDWGRRTDGVLEIWTGDGINEDRFDERHRTHSIASATDLTLIDIRDGLLPPMHPANLYQTDLLIPRLAHFVGGSAADGALVAPALAAIGTPE